jgi:hypothetical protein
MSIQELESRARGLENWQQYLTEKLTALESRLAVLDNQSGRRGWPRAEQVAGTPDGERQPGASRPRAGRKGIQ